MMAALAAVNAGTLSLDDPFEIERSTRTTTPGRSSS